MALGKSLSEHIQEQLPSIGELISTFGHCVEAFETKPQFSGPSVYFHAKTLSVLRSHGSAVEALGDDLYFDYLYATLASWGMHIMGRGGPKLCDIEEVRASFRAQRDAITELQGHRIVELDEAAVASVAVRVWDVVQALRIGVGETRLVVNSKALHHLLPDLVPPIDRQYTLRFFTGQRHVYTYDNWQGNAFVKLFQLFHVIAVTCLQDIQERIRTSRHGMNTSVTKVIDNAILGFMREEH
jgi:hypothetical protein